MAETRRLLGPHLATRAKVLLFLIIILSISAGRSEAQFGYGFGFGIENPRTEINFLNTWALQNGAAAAAERPEISSLRSNHEISGSSRDMTWRPTRP